MIGAALTPMDVRAASQPIGAPAQEAHADRLHPVHRAWRLLPRGARRGGAAAGVGAAGAAAGPAGACGPRRHRRRRRARPRVRPGRSGAPDLCRPAEPGDSVVAGAARGRAAARRRAADHARQRADAAARADPAGAGAGARAQGGWLLAVGTAGRAGLLALRARLRARGLGAVAVRRRRARAAGRHRAGGAAPRRGLPAVAVAPGTRRVRFARGRVRDAGDVQPGLELRAQEPAGRDRCPPRRVRATGPIGSCCCT